MNFQKKISDEKWTFVISARKNKNTITQKNTKIIHKKGFCNLIDILQCLFEQFGISATFSTNFLKK